MSDNQQEKYIDELKTNRNGLQELLNEIVGVRGNIKDIIPTTKEFSKRFILENRMKTMIMESTNPCHPRILVIILPCNYLTL